MQLIGSGKLVLFHLLLVYIHPQLHASAFVFFTTELKYHNTAKIFSQRCSQEFGGAEENLSSLLGKCLNC